MKDHYHVYAVAKQFYYQANGFPSVTNQSRVTCVTLKGQAHFFTFQFVKFLRIVVGHQSGNVA